MPTQKHFDPALAAKAARLSRDELVRLAARFTAQDEAHAKALAEKDDLLAAHEAELAQLRDQIRAAQAASTRANNHDYSEAETRDLYTTCCTAKPAGRWPTRMTVSTRSRACRPSRARVSSTTCCGAPMGCRSRWSRQSERRRARRSDSSRLSCTPTAWRRVSVEGR